MEDFDGTWYEAAILTAKADALDGVHDTSTPKLAAACGPNSTGARPPIDTTHAMSIASAMSRHICATTKALTLADGSKFEVQIDKSQNNLTKQPKYKRIATDTLTREHGRFLREHLAEHGLEVAAQQLAALHAGKPWWLERCEEIYTTIQDKCNLGEWGTIKAMVDAVCFLKPGEGTDRARFITMPGVNAMRAQDHQCALAPLVSIIEEMCKNKVPHTNFKGLSNTGKAHRVNELMHAYVPLDGTEINDDCIAFGYDKSANDRTWLLRDWIDFQRYLYDMDTIVLEATGEPLIAECFEGPPAAGSKYRLQFAKFVLVMDACFAYLFSGINPTSLANRNESTQTVIF